MSHPIEEDNNQDYLRAEDRIYSVATNRDEMDWKGFLHELINREGLDPWDIDVGILTKKYLEALKEAPRIDFNISGKLLTIAVFLLKTKAEVLVERDIRGIEQKIEEVQNIDSDFDDSLDMLGGLDDGIDEVSNKKQEYKLKVRNPLARKRKVNIFDLIKSLEKTFEQSNRRRKNFLLKNADVKYKGPVYERKPKDLKTIIEELYQIIASEFENKSGHVLFSHISSEANHKMAVLEKFIPLLHLHNQDKVYVEQEEHFGEIRIHEKRKEIIEE